MSLSILQKRIYTSSLLIFTVLLIFKFNAILVYFLIILGVLSILEFINLTKKINLNQYILILINSFFIFYVFVYCLFFFFFSNIEIFKLILFILLFGCIASDIGGFVFGKIFKGPKLTPISPNKTFTGSAGSLILSTIVVSFLSFFFINTLNFKIVLVALITSMFCQLGDLLFSFLKRKANLKDTGKILPGHGGILDRLDGIFLGIPFGFLALILFY